MSQAWYYARGSQKQGPISAKDLRELATSGKLQPTDLVWTEGMAEWKPASSVEGLCPEAPPRSGPPPLPPSASTASSAAGLTGAHPWPPDVGTKPPQSGGRTAVLVLCILGAFLSFLVGGCTSAMSEGLADAGESMNRFADEYGGTANRIQTEEMRSFGQNHLMMGFLEALLGMIGGIMGYRHYGTTNQLALGGVSLSRVTIAGGMILVALLMTITNTFSFFSAGILYGIAGALCLMSNPRKAVPNL